MGVGEYCNREVVVMTPAGTVREAARVMRDEHVGDVVVVDEAGGVRRPVGIVTDRDLVIEVVARDGDPDEITLADLVAGELVCAGESDDLWDTLKNMRDRGVRRVPIAAADGGLVGIITLDDYVDLLAEEMDDLVVLIRREQGREQKLRTRP